MTRCIRVLALSAEHGISRGVAREAIRVLESMGMVESRRRVGITVRPSRNWNVFDPRVIRWRLQAGDRAVQLASLSELRRGFEPAAAARRANPEQCRVLAAAVSDMVVHGRASNLDAYLLADRIFHQTSVEASGNEMFRALNDVVAEALSRAIRLRDEDGAERAMRAIIDEAATAVIAGDVGGV